MFRLRSGRRGAPRDLVARLCVGALASALLPIAWAPPAAAAACTATPTTSGSYTLISFTSTGTCEWTPPQDGLGVQYLIVGGGGGGQTSRNGNWNGGGGGGAGGVLTGKTTVSGSQSITVGAGGAANAAGSDSVALGLTAAGGGKGGGGNGGSGGGGSWTDTTGGSGTTGQGNKGGNGSTSANTGGGGGGGAGGAGGSNSGASAGAGGSGLSSSITGSAVTYAEGGRGGIGYLSGGTVGTAGGANTGDGGGGGTTSSTSPFPARAGGAGGSGIVVLRYLNAPSLAVTRSGDSISITIPSLSGAITGFKYSLDGTTWTSATPGTTATTTASGAVTVSLRATNSVSGDGAITSVPVPTISTEPADASVRSGDTATFSVVASATSGSLTYQWQRSTDGGTTWANASGGTEATTATYTSPTVSYAATRVLYRVQVTNTVSGTTARATSAAAALIVGAAAPTITAQPMDVSKAVGQSATFSVTATRPEGSLSYQWFKGGEPVAGATSATYTINSVRLADAGNYSVVVTNTLSGGEPSSDATSSATATLTVGAPVPAFTRNPVSITRQPGDSATFSASVADVPEGTLSYQWFKGAAAIDGATTSTYTIDSVRLADAATYKVVATSTLEGATPSTGSSEASATLTVGAAAPSITAQPQSVTAASGRPASFTVVAAEPVEGTLSYQWFKGSTAISGATAPTYTIDSVRLASAGSYSVTVTTTLSGGTPTTATSTSNSASLVIGAPSAVITDQPDDVTVVAGQTASFAVVVDTPPEGAVSYIWERSTDGGRSWSDISGAPSSPTYTTPALRYTATKVQYRVKVSITLTNATPQVSSVYSQPATVTVGTPAPTISAQPVSTGKASGQSVTFSATASSFQGFLTYQWFKDGSLIPGATAASYTKAGLRLADAGEYSVEVTNSISGAEPGSASTTSSAATLTIGAPSVAIASQPDSVSTQFGSSATFAVSILPPVEGNVTYQWFKGTQAISGATSSAYTLTSLTLADAGDYTVQITNTLSGGTPSTAVTTSAVATLKVGAPTPVISAQPTAVAARSGEQPQFTATMTAPIAGTLSYEWQYLDGSTWVAATSGTASASGQLSTYTLSSATLAQSGSYRLQVTNTLVGADPVTAVTTSRATSLTVGAAVPTITVEPQPATAESGAASATFSVTATIPEGQLSYQWFKNGNAIAGATSGTLTLSGVRLSDAGQYSVQVSNTLTGGTPGVASVRSQSATLTVTAPAPAIAADPSAQSVVAGSSATFTVTATSSEGSLSYQWLKDGNPILGATSRTYIITAARVADEGWYSVRVTNTLTAGVATAVTSQPAGLSVAAPPPAFAQQPSDVKARKDETATLWASVSPIAEGTVTYRWQVFDGADWVDVSGGVASVSPDGLTAAYVTGAFPSVNRNGIQYRVIATTTLSNATTSSTTSSAATVYVYEPLSAAPSIDAGPSGASAVVGGNATLSVAASVPLTDPIGVLTYRWQRWEGGDWINLAGADGATYTTPALMAADDGASYRVVVTNSQIGEYASNSVVSSSATVSVAAPAPVIATQPMGALVAPGSVTTLRVRVNPLPTGTLSYQWQSSTDALNWTNEAGGIVATDGLSSAFTTPAAVATTVYRVVVTSTVDGLMPEGTTSASATLTFVAQPAPAPVISIEPASQVDALVGGTATISVSSTTPGATYQWERQDANGNWWPVDGATSDSLSLPGLSGDDNDTKYRVVVTNSEAGKAPTSWTSPETTITVSAEDPVITSTRTDVTLAVGQSVQFGVTAYPPTSGGTLSYQWFRDGVAIDGARGATLPLDPILVGDQGVYTVAVTNSAPGADPSTVTFTSGTLTIPASATLQFDSQPADVRAPVGEIAQFGVVVSAGPAVGTLSYQWQKSIDAGASWGDISGATTSTFDTSALTVSDSGMRVRVVVTNVETGMLPTATTSAVAAITVIAQTPQVDPDYNPVAETPLLGSSVTFTAPVEPNTDGGTLSYQWFLDGVLIGGATSSTLVIDPVTAGSAGTYTVRVTNTLGVESSSAALDVGSITIPTSVSPVIVTEPTAISVPAATTASFSVAAVSAQGVLGYRWQSKPSGGTWSDIPGATSSTYETDPLYAADSGMDFRVVVVNTETGKLEAEVVSTAAAVTVATPDPVILAQPADASVPSGQTATFSVSTSPQAPGTGALSYQWQRSTDGGAQWSDVGTDSPSYTTGTVSYTSVEVRYRVKVTNSLTGATPDTATVISDYATLTVGAPAPVISAQPQAVAAAAGDQAAFTVTVEAPFEGTLSYQWFKDGVAIEVADQDTYTIPAIVLADAADYSVSVTNRIVGANPESTTVASRAVALTVAAPTPVISAQPQDTAVPSYDPATFTVSATAVQGTLSYQWQSRPDGSSAWTDIVGATDATYTTADLVVDDAGSQFRVAVTTTLAGATPSTATVTSDAASVKVGAPDPDITLQPSNVSVRSGQPATFTVAATAVGTVSYQWQTAPSTTGPWTDIVGATAHTYTTPGLLVADVGTAYRVAVTNTNEQADPATATVFSDVATVSVGALEPLIHTQPADARIVSGETATFTVSVASPVEGQLSYQWQESVNAGIDWVDVGTDASAFTTGVRAFATPAVLYRVRVTNTLTGGDPGTATTTSVPAAVTVGAPAPVIDAAPVNAAVRAGESASFSVTASSTEGALRYQWQTSTDGGVQWIDVGADSASYTTPALFFASPKAQYRVKVTNTIPGADPMTAFTISAPVDVTIGAPAPTIATQPAATEVNAGQRAVLSVTADQPVQGALSYQWYAGGTPIAGATAASYEIPSVRLRDAGSYTVEITNTIVGASPASESVTSDPATLTVGAPAVSIDASPVDANPQTGQAATFTVGASVVEGTLSYQWQVSTDGGVQWTDIPGATGQAYTTQPVSYADNAREYRVVVTNTLVGAIPQTSVTESDPALLTVAALAPVDPGVIPVPKEPLLGERVTFDVDIPVPADGGTLTYQWYLDGVLIDGATADTVIIDPVTEADHGRYTVVVTNTLPNGQSASTTLDAGSITIPSAPVPVIVVAPVPARVLAGQRATFTVSATAGIGILDYQWQVRGSSGRWVDVAGATNASYTTAPMRGRDEGAEYRVVLTSTQAGTLPSVASSDPVDVEVGAPAPEPGPDGPVTVTTGVDGIAHFTASVAPPFDGSLSYQWLRNGLPIRGATAVKLTIDPVRAGDAGIYTVRVTLTLGNGRSASSTIAGGTLIVATPGPLRPETSAGGKKPGAYSVVVSGSSIPAELTHDSGSVAITGGTFNLRLSGVNPDGSSARTDSRGNLVLTPSGSLRTSGSGFASAAPVNVIIMSTPRTLGQLTTDRRGTFGGTLKIPSDLRPGTHTVQVNGFTSDGQVRSISLGITVTAEQRDRKQQPGNEAANPPKRIANNGITVLAGVDPRTDMGERIATSVACFVNADRTSRMQPAGDLDLCTPISGPRGKMSIRTYGWAEITVVVTQTAPAARGHDAYLRRTVYRDGVLVR